MSRDPKELYRDGLTVRDHFAGRALQAMLAVIYKEEGWSGINTVEKRGSLAATAYEVADAMLEVRSR